MLSCGRRMHAQLRLLYWILQVRPSDSLLRQSVRYASTVLHCDHASLKAFESSTAGFNADLCSAGLWHSSRAGRWNSRHARYDWKQSHGAGVFGTGPVGGGDEDFAVHCGSFRNRSLRRKTRRGSKLSLVCGIWRDPQWSDELRLCNLSAVSGHCERNWRVLRTK